MLLVSIIIITRNRPMLLSHCLRRVFDQQYPCKEIIVVDSSSDDETERLVAQYPEIVSVQLREQFNNMPQARNEGIAVALGDIIAFIDDDAMVYPHWLEALVDAYQDSTVGAVGGRIVTKPEPYCDLVSGTPNLSISRWGSVIADDVSVVNRDKIEVDHLIGCNMSFRRAALEQVGGFDPEYTLTNLREETDVCFRVKRAGWRVLFVPEMTVVHVSVRSKKFFTERPGIQFSNGRNVAYFAVKHLGLSPRTLLGQIMDTGSAYGRAFYYAGLFVSGAMAQTVGRVVGIGVGMAWLVSSQRRKAAAPPISKRSRLMNKDKSSPDHAVQVGDDMQRQDTVLHMNSER